MAIVRPFKAIRPDKAYADKVVSLPYDVMNRKEAAEMAEGNPYSFLHICRAEIDMPEQENPYDKSVYEKAKSNIAENLEKGIFIQDEAPLFYIYRQIMEGRVQTGIVGTVSVDEYQNNTIKKHEFTRVEKEIDRINHFDICDANTEPVFLTYRDDKRIRVLVEGWAASNEPEYDITTDDGIRHILWSVTDEELVANISQLFGDVPALYIADGHHRSASACKVGLKRREENPDYTGEEEFNFFMAVIFPDADLNVFDYNRVVQDLNGNTAAEFLDKVAAAGFEVEKVSEAAGWSEDCGCGCSGDAGCCSGENAYRPEAKHTFGMFLEGCWYKLTASPEIIPDHVIDSLDVAILQNNLLDPILGIKDPRTDDRIGFVGGIRGLGELEKRCSEDMKVAFAVHPVEIEDLMRVSDNDMVMPPKSTWFEPKLGSGLFLHQL